MIVLGAAVIAAALVFLATEPPGPALHPDSMAYTGVATSLVRTGRLRVPTGDWSSPDSTSALSLWPPGYPAAIALPMLEGVDPVQSARWVNIAAAAVTGGVLAAIATSTSGAVAATLLVLFVFATEAVMSAYFAVLSEPLFVALFLVTVALMAFARDRLLLLGLAAAGAVMVRYAGAAAPAAVTCWTLLDGRYSARKRFQRAFVVALVPAIAIVAWFVRTALAPDRHATPEVHVYGNWGVAAAQAGETLTSWLVPLMDPGRMRTAIAVVIGAVLAAFVLAALRDTTSGRYRLEVPDRVHRVLGAGLLLSAWYIVVVLAARAFVGGTIPLDWRIFVPLIVLWELMAVVAIAFWWRAYHFPVRIVLAAGALAWLAASATVTVSDVQFATTEGSDFAGVRWRDSALLAWVRAHGRGHTLYSNWPPAVYFHASRLARDLPDSTEMKDLGEFVDQLRATNGYVVGFPEKSPDVIAPDSLARLLGLPLITRLPDGAVWGAPPASGVMPVAAPAATAAVSATHRR